MKNQRKIKTLRSIVNQYEEMIEKTIKGLGKRPSEYGIMKVKKMRMCLVDALCDLDEEEMKG